MITSVSAYSVNDFLYAQSESSWVNAPSGIYVFDNGTRAYLFDDDTDIITSRDLTTPYDITTNDSLTTDTYNIGFAITIADIDFSSDGTLFFVLNNAIDSIYTYSLSTPFKVSTASLIDTTNVYNGLYDAQPSGMAFNNDGTKLYVNGRNKDRIYQFNLTTPYNISTFIYDDDYYYISYTSESIGLDFSSDGNYVIVQDATNVYGFNITSFDVGTIVYDGTLPINGSTARGECSIAENNIYITNYDDDTIYQYNTTYIPSTTIYNVSTSYDPEDIYALSTLEVNVNASISVNDETTLNGSATFYHVINSSLNNNCVRFENRVCTQESNTFNSIVMNEVNNSFYNLSIDDNIIYGGYFPFDYEIMESTIKTGGNIYKNNNLAFYIQNFSITNDTLYYIEFSGGSNSDNYPMNVYYCNSSYAFEDSSTSSNCELVDTFILSGLLNHTHDLTTHYSFNINPSINRTQESYVIFSNEAPNILFSYYINYFTNVTHTNNDFYLEGEGTTRIYDIHLHQFIDDDRFLSYVTYVNNGVYTNSSLNIDTYEYDDVPPTGVMVYDPCDITYSIDSASNTGIYFNWSKSTDINNDTITYRVSRIIEGSILSNNLFNTTSTEYTYYTNSSGWYDNNYKTLISACDDENECTTTISACSYDVCIPNWNLTPSACTDGVRMNIYTDVNSCGLYNDVPLINGTYQECKTKAETENQTLIAILIVFILLILLWLITRNYVIGFINLLYVGLVISYIMYANIFTDNIVLIGCVFIELIFLLIIFFQVKNKN